VGGFVDDGWKWKSEKNKREGYYEEGMVRVYLFVVVGGNIFSGCGGKR
jgi:hypothetical protein